VQNETAAMVIAAFIPGHSGGTAAAFPHSQTVTFMEEIKNDITVANCTIDISFMIQEKR
jgi:hypothetical protein